MQIGAGNFCLNTYAIATSYVNIIQTCTDFGSIFGVLSAGLFFVSDIYGKIYYNLISQVSNQFGINKKISS